MASALYFHVSRNMRSTHFVLIFLLSAMIPTAANAADSDVLVSGVNEFETGMSDDGSGMTTSDPAISKIELQFNSPESRPFGALLRLKHEPDEDEVDEAYLRYQFGGKNKFAIIAGESYTPFGHFDSSLITDSMTLTVGESRLQGLKFESDRGDWTASVFASTDSSDSSSRVASGAGINFHRGKDWRGYGLGIAAISNIAIADEIHSALSSPGVNSKTVPALAAHAIYGDGTNQIIVDAVTATERFAPGELAFAGDGAQPGAWRTEVARHFQFLDKPMTVAASWQQSHEALALSLPQTRIGAGLSAELSRNASLALELLHDTAYPVSVGGSGGTYDTLTLKFALTF